MATATGTFTVLSGSEETYHEAPGEPKLTRARGKQRFSGDIEGDGSIEWLMCYFPDHTARLVGIQRVEGSLGGRSGSFLIEAVGDHTGKSSRASWRVIAGSGTGGLEGVSGEGEFEAPGGPEVRYRLEYDLGSPTAAAAGLGDARPAG